MSQFRISSGACVLDNRLFVYYGAADKVCCLATVDLQEIIDYLLSDACAIGLDKVMA